MGSLHSAVVAFGSAREASRRIAGVSTAGRIVRELAAAGVARVWLDLTAGEALDKAAIADLGRLAGTMDVCGGRPPAGDSFIELPGDRLVDAAALAALARGDPAALEGALDLTRRRAAAEILRRTAKATDGPVSRWINRPVSRALSAILLMVPGFRPNHATAGTAVIALAMFAALVMGGTWGLIVGGLLFQAASVFDGVDGEVARATFRSSEAGAALDTAVDTATTFLFIIGLAANLVSSGQQGAFFLAAWSVVLVAIGLALVRWRAGSSNFDRLKQHYRDRFSGPVMPKVMAFLTIISSRDFFAFANAGMILVGFPLGPLIGFAASASVWIVFVGAWVLAPQSPPLPAENA